MFAYLALHEGHAVPRDELAEVLWGEELPATWEKALGVLMAKLRPLLEECGIARSTGLTSASGRYKLTLPADAWIDVPAAASAVERAEAALTAGDLEEARAQASTAADLSRPTFLPGEDGLWVEEQRRYLRDVLVRALECLRDASLATARFGDAVRHAAEIIELEPFRESSYRALMQADAAAGNPAEALRVYERCRQFLADELGVYPSPETEAVYLEILRNPPGRSESVDRPAEEDPRDELPPTAAEAPPLRSRRQRALVAGVVLFAAGATAAALAFASPHKPPVKLLPNSLVRLDPETLQPKQVIPIGPKADQIAVAGGYVWVIHAALQHTTPFSPATGDRYLTIVDSSTGKPTTFGNGLAPCGLTPDPTGDMWVANCYGPGPRDLVARVNGGTRRFEQKLYVRDRPGYYRGMARGGGSLWVADPSGDEPGGLRVTQLDLRSPGAPPGSIQLDRHATALAWSDVNEELWMSNFSEGSVTRLNFATGHTKTFENVATETGSVVVHDDAVWVADWDGPRVVRLPAVGSGPGHSVFLHVTHPRPGGYDGLVSLAADDSGIWAAVPDDHAVFRIDPKTNHSTRIPLKYQPWGVALGDDAIWVTLRGR